MQVQIEAFDRTGTIEPDFDFTKLSVFCGANGAWNNASARTYLTGNYVREDGISPSAPGTYTIRKSENPNYSSGDHTYTLVNWMLSVQLTDNDLAIFKNIVDNYNGEPAINAVQSPGFTSGGSSDESASNITIRKTLAVRSEITGQVKLKCEFNGNSSSATLNGPITYDFPFNASAMADTVSITYNGVTIEVAVPDDLKLTITEAMFAQI